MRILLTAFGTFGSHSMNPSEHIARGVGDRWACPDASLTVDILPVEYAGARSRVEELGYFDWHLALGLAADRTVPTLERFAMNRQDSPSPDNTGHVGTGEEIAEDGPLALESSLPNRELLRWAAEAGFPLEESLSAGLYVCNTVMYTAIHTSGHAGFLHLPPGNHFPIRSGIELTVGLLKQLVEMQC